MKIFKLQITARKNGAIGITYPMTVEVQAVDEHKIMDALYKAYEHISSAKILSVREA